MNRLLAAWLLAGPLCSRGQPDPRTLLPQSLIRGIVDEVSGTSAYQHILDLAGYEHGRLESEYKTTYRETSYIEKPAVQYGLENVQVERFKLPAKTACSMPIPRS